MSSHSVKLARTLRDAAKVKQALKENVKDEYTRGLYNGIELAMSLLSDRPAEVVDKVPNVSKPIIKKNWP